MSWSEMQPLLVQGFWDTLYMVVVSTVIAIVGGLPLGILLVLTDRGGLLQNTVVNKVIGQLVNITRSMPFIILMVALMGFTRWLTGSTIGREAAIVPLAIGAIPFFARLVETAVREVDHGLVEAVQSMGGNTWTVVRKVLVPESLPSLISSATTTVVALIGYSAMAGVVGAGGLGDLAYRYGYQRFESGLMWVTVAILAVIITAIQFFGDYAAKSLSRRGGRGAGGRTPNFLRKPLVVKFGAAAAVVAVIGAGIVAFGGKSEDKLVVAASPTPHAKILDYVRDNLAAKAGLDLEVKEFSDFVTPNQAVQDGSVDANFFQHQPYLDDYNKKNGSDIVPVVGVHLEPLGLYSQKIKKLDDLKSGAVVALPNDTVNEARALKLLDANGLIKLKDDAGKDATPKDIAENPKNIQFKELEAAIVPRSLGDVDAAIINGNYAVEADLSPAKDALVQEKPKGNPYTNLLAVKKGEENDPRVQKLAKLLQSPEVKKYIEDEFDGAVLPAEDSATEDGGKLVVGATAGPAGEVLDYVRENLADEAGLDLQVKEFTDYVLPNTALQDGELDANLYQHKPFLDDFNASKGADLVPVTNTYLAPMGVYSNELKSLDKLGEGATVAVPNDTTNEGRALQLLASKGLIELREGAGPKASPADVVKNPKNLTFKELEPAQLPRSLEDVDASVINSNYAIDAGLNPQKDSILVESPKDNPYVNVLAVKKGQEDDPQVRKLAKLLTSPEVTKFLKDTYDGSVLPATAA